jgi:anion-transporting  ArsA/GET3 family ATPase
MYRAEAKDLLDLDFVFVVGKGGVGKTTVSAALALAAARQGKRCLIAMCNAKERLSGLLEVGPVGAEIRELAPGVDAVNMNPEAALEEYGMMVLKVRTLYRAIFENRFVSAFLHGTPGIDAWAMLGKAYYHTTERTREGQKRYDLVILDAPATGHGLDMLRVPQVIVDVAPPGLLRREAERALDLFRDPERAGVALVTLPEDMPTNETLELYEVLRDELNFPVNRLVINGVLPTLFPREQHDTFAELPSKLAPESPLWPLARAARTRAVREALQRQHLERLRSELHLARTELPHLFVTPFARGSVESLSRTFD